MTAYTPTGFALLDGWEFGFNKRRICGGGWDHIINGKRVGYMYVNVYGIGYVSDESYVKFKYMLKHDDLPVDVGWINLGNGVANQNGYFLFDHCLSAPKDAQIIMGAFNSRDELLNVFANQQSVHPGRVAAAFAVNYPTSVYNHKYAIEQYRSY